MDVEAVGIAKLSDAGMWRSGRHTIWWRPPISWLLGRSAGRTAAVNRRP